MAAVRVATLSRDAPGGCFGFTLVLDSNYLHRIKAVGEDSPAAAAGVRAGDIIHAIDGKPLAKSTTVVSAIKLVKEAADTLELSLEDDGGDFETADAAAEAPGVSTTPGPLRTRTASLNAGSKEGNDPKATPTSAAAGAAPGTSPGSSPQPPAPAAVSPVRAEPASPALSSAAGGACISRGSRSGSGTNASSTPMLASPAAALAVDELPVLAKPAGVAMDIPKPHHAAALAARAASPALGAASPAARSKLCALCHREVPLLSYCEANGLAYHVRCFECSRCGDSLVDEFQFDEESPEKLLCVPCWQKAYGSVCIRCDRAIAPDTAIVHANDETYHMVGEAGALGLLWLISY
jgi:hypothetical protein